MLTRLVAISFRLSEVNLNNFVSAHPTRNHVLAPVLGVEQVGAA